MSVIVGNMASKGWKTNIKLRIWKVRRVSKVAGIKFSFVFDYDGRASFITQILSNARCRNRWPFSLKERYSAGDRSISKRNCQEAEERELFRLIKRR
jgi:hypothetical protein